jgi:hypothetical protein
MEIGEDSWEHVPPLLLNCGQEDNVGGHEEYLHNAEEVSDCIYLLTARGVSAHVFFNCSWIKFKPLNASFFVKHNSEEKRIKPCLISLILEYSTVINLVWILGALVCAFI